MIGTAISRSRGPAFLLACGLHAAVIIGLVGVMRPLPQRPLQELASVELLQYDPAGSSAGSSPAAAPPPPEPAPAAPEETPSVIESRSAAVNAPERPVKQPVARRKKPSPAVKSSASRPQAHAGEDPGEASPPADRRQGSAGQASGSGNGTRDEVKAWRAHLVKRINANKRYPRNLRSRRLAGDVKVSFTLHSSGHVASVHIIKSSGHPEFDREALALFKRASPFKPAPASISADALSYTLSIRFLP